MSKFLDENGVEYLAQSLVNSTKTINSNSIWGSGNISIDPKEIDKYTTINITYNGQDGSGLSRSSVSLTSKNTNIYLNCLFKENTCPYTGNGITIRIPSTNNLDYYRVVINAVDTTTRYQCTEFGGFFDFVGNTSVSLNPGVLFSPPMSGSSVVDHAGEFTSTGLYSRIQWGGVTSVNNALVIDFYKTKVQLDKITVYYYLGNVRAINGAVKFPSNYKI